jgi:hypothetical protein
VSHRVSKLVSSLLSAIAGGLLAQSAWPADSLAQKIEACARQQEDAARLKCFDHEASVLRAEGATRRAAAAARAAAPPAAIAATTAPAVTAARAPTAMSAPAATPAPALSGSSPENPAQPLAARIVSISTTPADGALRFELDNGQVWQQNERETYLSLAAGDSVQIKVGSFKSFVLRTPSGVTTRVHQIR